MLPEELIEPFKASLFRGHYNLLLGSGTSLDSRNANGKPLLSTSNLAKKLCEAKGVSETTSLSRVSLLLSPDEITTYLTTPFSNCNPGATAFAVTRHVWRSIYTFNIDDVLENAYQKTRARQSAVPHNFDAPYETSPNLGTVGIVHLHGFVRQPASGYVFSTADYGRVTRGLNPWMHVLSEILETEPFILSGTSLNEPDLEYYLQGRTPSSQRTNRGPSLLVEPYPDAVTEKLCELHGLTLVTTTLDAFLSWVETSFGPSPFPSALVVPSLSQTFSQSLPPSAQVEFFSSFELVKQSSANPEGEISPFFYGSAPRWSDVESNLDLPVKPEIALTASLKNYLSDMQPKKDFFLVLGASGSGKSTLVRRTAYSLAKDGFLVFNLSGKASIDLDNTRQVLSALTKPAVLLIDNFADHARSILSVVSGLPIKAPLAILVADRDYRADHIRRVFGDISPSEFLLPQWDSEKFTDLIERYRQAGLVGSHEALRSTGKFANLLTNDSVAVAGCRILNDFKPLEQIIRSVWADASADEQKSYGLAALAEYCYSGGVSYSILKRAHRNDALNGQLVNATALPLAYSADGDYVLPLNPILGERILQGLSRNKPRLLSSLFQHLALALAPYVNRHTIVRRSPEARLAGRLFSAESVVKPLLGDQAEQFFIAVKDRWEWNSRYWEQRALLLQDTNLEQAIQFARHAVAIEDHPFTKTTLASLLTRNLEGDRAPTAEEIEKIIALLDDALKGEQRRGWRPTPHPYAVLFKAIEIGLRKGVSASHSTNERAFGHADKCRQFFPRDEALLLSVDRALELMRTS